jgi:hypothetical protein
MTREERLARALERGYLLAPRGELWVIYRVRCLRQLRPCVFVSVRKGHAQGQLDLETTRKTLDGPCTRLSEHGAQMIRDFCARVAPRARLVGVNAGSHLAIVSRVPAHEADALGETLIEGGTTSTRNSEGDAA